MTDDDYPWEPPLAGTEVEDYTFTVKLSGQPIGAPWDTTGWDGSNDWEFSSAADDTPEQLSALWDGAVEPSRRRLDAALAEDPPAGWRASTGT